MKRFLIHVSLFSILPFLLLGLSIYYADGTSDNFYLRFTSPKQKSLILGTSRAAQGLQPYIINAVFEQNNIPISIYNYSFTLFHSSYGPAYFNSITKKIDERTKNSIFILAVDPWSISANIKNPNDSTMFDEKNYFIGKTKDVNSSPNIEYLLNSFSEPLFTILKKAFVKKTYRPYLLVHKDGWLEVYINMDSASVTERIKNKIHDYKEINLTKFRFSNVRYSYLKKTIDYLKPHGNIYIVRMPVLPQIRETDDALIPNFDSLMNNLCVTKNLTYIDFADDGNKYQYTDGNHIYKESGKLLSKILAERIVAEEKKHK